MPEENIRRKRRLSSFQIIILGFAGVILLGALLLMLPMWLLFELGLLIGRLLLRGRAVPADA